jgi:exosortase
VSVKFGNISLASRDVCFVFLTLVSWVIGWQSLLTVWQSALRNEQRTHILLVLPVSVVLLYLHRAKVFENVKYDWAGAIALGLLAAAWVGIVRYSDVLRPEDLLSWSMFFLVGWWTSAFLLCYGKQAFRSAASPLLFLILLVPIPEFVLSRTIWLLQGGSADVTYAFLRAAQVPVLRRDVILSLPGIDIEVAQECSGIRSSLMLFLVSLVLGHLFLRSSWRKLLLTVAVFPITVVKNGLRIFTLSTLAVYVDPSFLHGWLHHSGGVVFFALALAALMSIVWVFHNAEKKAGKGGSQQFTGPSRNPILLDGNP